jgi:hypothetical protein
LLPNVASRNADAVDGTDTVIPIDRSKPLTLDAVTVVVDVDPWLMLRLDGDAASE